MPTDFTKRGWRKLARQGNWRDLHPEDYQGLEAADRAALIAELQRYVPKHVVGHGLEMREVHLHPRKARGPDQIVASVALFKLQREADRESHPKGRIFGEAIELAKEVLKVDLGVREYHGLLATYLQRFSDGSFEQVDLATLSAEVNVGRPFIIGKREPIQMDELQLRYALGEVGVAYGAASVQTLAGFWKLGSFELNSPADHAVSILDAALRIDILATQSLEPQAIDRKLDYLVWELVECAFEVGRHFDALMKKRVETLAQQKLEHTEKNRANAPKGGQAKKGKLRREVLNRLAIADKNFCTKRFDGAAEVLMVIDTKHAIARAMKLTERYDCDRSPEEKLFSLRGKSLSKQWYEAWWEEFRSKQKIHK